jgi:hypothetical protein
VVVSANLDFGEEFSDGEIGLMGGSLGFTTLTFYHAMYTPHYLLLAVKAYNK